MQLLAGVSRDVGYDRIRVEINDDDFQAYLESSNIPRLQVYLTTRRSSNKRAVDKKRRMELKWRAGGVCVEGLCVVSTDGGGVVVWMDGWMGG